MRSIGIRLGKTSTSKEAPCCRASSPQTSARRSLLSIRRSPSFAAASSWDGTASDGANTNTSAIRSCLSFMVFAPALYPQLAPVANRWKRSNGNRGALSREARRFRPSVPRCRTTATHSVALAVWPRRLQLPASGLYGEHVFPIQVAILLSDPQRDFTGGEFVLTEQRPRMQSRPEVVPLHQGGRCGFRGSPPARAGHARHLSRQPPARVSRLRSGKRHTVGIIFHDAN